MSRLGARFTRVLVVVGLLALASVDDQGAVLAAVGLVGVALSWLATHPHRPRVWAVATALVAMFTALAPSLMLVPWGSVGVALLVYLQLHRARTGSGPSDDRVALVLALLMLLYAGASRRSPAVGLALLTFVLLAPGALATLELRATELRAGDADAALGRRGILGLAGASTLLTAAFFLLLPRIDAELLASGQGDAEMSGFEGADVNLGDLAGLQGSEELILRVRVSDANDEPLYGPFYLRGLALDWFDGVRWASSRTATQREIVEPYELGRRRLPPGALRQEVHLEPTVSAPLFATPTVTRVFTDERVQVDELGGRRFDDAPRRRRYTVWVDPSLGDGAIQSASASQGRFALQLPSELDPRVRALALQLVGDAATPEEKARRITRHLQDTYAYRDIPAEGEAGQGLSAFLFDTRRGHCEYFATALAVLLRAVDVRAVVVIGFYGGEWNDVGGHINVRRSDAHAWVEAELSPGRWTLLDATPAGGMNPGDQGLLSALSDTATAWWSRWVLDYDLTTQIEGGRALANAFAPSGDAAPGGPAPGLASATPILVGLGALVLAVGARGALYGPSKAPRRVIGPEERAWREGLTLAQRRGHDPPAALPPVEAAEWIVARVGEPARPLLTLAWLHHEARYGPGPPPDGASRAKAALRALRLLPRAVRPIS
ncbi:transglutaminaseTgpA domain-containing protein [Myxococcota bacterium]|nr:transglutaminaseTgpA domain-containing protein [Myxococcota bacterium]